MKKRRLKAVSAMAAFLLAMLCIQDIHGARAVTTAILSSADTSSEYTELAGAGDSEAAPMSLSGFLEYAGLDFKAYHAMMAEIMGGGGYPHFLSENARRYEAFQEKNPEVPFGVVIAYVNANVDLGFYEVIEPVGDPYNVSALVNKNFALPAGWVPGDLVDIGSGHRLREEAARYLPKMMAALNEDGLRIHVISSFRSYRTQANSHRRAVGRVGLEVADMQFARPGHSEHQLGLALDVLHRTGFAFMSQARFENTPEFAWMLENAHNFGFIFRYPYEYTDIHGYIFEPWHWRFVGVDIATAMYNEGIALFEEFYGRYLAPGVLERVRADLLGRSTLAEVNVNGESFYLLSYRFGDCYYFEMLDIAYMLSGTAVQVSFVVDSDCGTKRLTSLEPGVGALSDRLLKDVGGQAVLAPPSRVAVVIDGEEVELPSRNIGGKSVFKLHYVVEALGFDFERSVGNDAITIIIDEVDVFAEILSRALSANGAAAGLRSNSTGLMAAAIAEVEAEAISGISFVGLAFITLALVSGIATAIGIYALYKGRA
ncbi:MAG: M15 family metallopeptidase [Oscillospiraceae bacterium]|nr:M15 family metallopeptidase [Oscillospiraceae bacterium]